MKKFSSIMKEVEGNEGEKCHYPVRMDTYGCGCFHDCNYCYSKSLLQFRNLWNPNNPSVADIDEIRKKIRHIRPGEIVRLGGMTDRRTCRNIYIAWKDSCGYMTVITR